MIATAAPLSPRAFTVRPLRTAARPKPRMTSRISLALTCPLLGTALLAQPVCSITLGPDETICQGETVQLNGPPGFPNYRGSNVAKTQDITVCASS